MPGPDTGAQRNVDAALVRWVQAEDKALPVQVPGKGSQGARPRSPGEGRNPLGRHNREEDRILVGEDKGSQVGRGRGSQAVRDTRYVVPPDGKRWGRTAGGRPGHPLQRGCRRVPRRA